MSLRVISIHLLTAALFIAGLARWHTKAAAQGSAGAQQSAAARRAAAAPAQTPTEDQEQPSAGDLADQKSAVDAAMKTAQLEKSEADEVKNATLMSSGVTGGVAAVLQMKGFHNDVVTHSGLSPTAMPYVMLLPGYWGANDETKQACASSWTFSDRELAANAALSAARKRAKLIFDGASIAIQSQLQGLADESIQLLGLTTADSSKFSEMITTWLTLADGAAKDTENERIIEIMARALWNPALNAYCAVRRIGVWFGYPIAYNTDVSFKSEGAKAVEREVTPRIAFGGGFSPNKYFTLLLGFTVSQVTREQSEDLPKLRRNVWATTLGLGGNLDIFTALTK
jgi:hypothetical protein